MERKYVAFISYRHAPLDSMVAKQVHTLVEQFVIPRNMRKGKKRLGIVFRDQEELPVSSDLSADICNALDQSQYLIVICTGNTAKSPWVGREIDYFLSHHDRNNAFAVLAEGEPVDVFPLALTRIPQADGSFTDVEPLAVDVRADTEKGVKKKLKREITRLHAALIGCPYDALVMREQRRKRRRLAAVMAVVLAVATGFSTLMLVKNQQINQKNLELENKNQTLAQQKEEITRQKETVQLRESELLTEKGMTALEQADTQQALTNFLAALPRGQEQRPYYALAEQGLFSALEAFSPERESKKMFTVELDQGSPIRAYRLSQDGERAVTLDSYGVLTCFDTADGSVLWTRQTGSSTYYYGAKILNCPEDARIILCFGSMIAAVDWEDGQILWQRQERINRNMYLSGDGKTLGWVVMDTNEDYSRYLCTYLFVSAETGEPIQSIPLGESDLDSMDADGVSYYVFPDNRSSYSGSNAAFSSDDRYFATSYLECTDDGGCYLRYLLLDLQTGSWRELYCEELPGNYGDEVGQFRFVDGDTALLAFRINGGSDSPVRADKLDLQTGDVIWHFEAPEVDYQHMIIGDEPLCTVLTDNVLLVGRGKCMYALRPHSGELVHTKLLRSNIAALEPLQDVLMSVILEDGSYCVCWANKNDIFFTDEWYNIGYSLGPVYSATLWNEGIFRVELGEDYSIGQIYGDVPGKGHGKVIVLPEKEGDRLLIKYLVDFLPVTGLQAVSQCPDENLIKGWVWELEGDRLLLGAFSQLLESDAYCVLDKKTRTVTDQIFIEGNISLEKLFFLPDASGYYTTAKYGELSYHNVKTGKTQVLFAETPVPIPLENNLQVEFTYTKFTYSGANQADGSLLMAAMEKDTLYWWKNAGKPVAVSIPEDIRVESYDVVECHRLLWVGPNGYILVETFRDEDVYADGFAIYDTAADTWYRFEHDIGLHADQLLAFSEDSGKVAVCDTQNRICIYDIPGQRLLADIQPQLPWNALQALRFLQDRYLAIYTTDARVLIYEISTEEQVYCQQMEGGTGTLFMAVDTDNSRLFLWDDYSNTDKGYCVDMTDWILLAEIEGLIYYDPQNNEAYLYRYSWEDGESGIRVCQVPSLEKLVQTAWEILEG